MSYQRQSNQLNIKTAPTNVGGYQPRSAIAEAFQGAESLLKSRIDLQNTRIQNESRELSLHTQILQVEAQEAERVKAERAAAAARARRAAEIDAMQNYATVNAAGDLALNEQLRSAGKDPALIVAATNGRLKVLNAAFDALPEGAKDRVFNNRLAAETKLIDSTNSSLFNIAVGQHEQRVEDAYFVTSSLGMGPEAIADTIEGLYEEGESLGIPRNQTSESLMTNAINVQIAQSDVNNMSYEERRDFASQLRQSVDNVIGFDARATGKDYHLRALETIGQIEAMNRVEAQRGIETAISNGNIDDFARYMVDGTNDGFVDSDEATQYHREYMAADLARKLDPDALAITAFQETNGIANAEDLFPSNDKAATAFKNLQRDSIRTAITQQTVDGDNLIREHAALDTPNTATEINREVATNVGQVVSLLRQMPSDPTSPEYQEAAQRLNEHRQQIARMESLGGRHLSEDNRRDVATLSVFLNNSDTINAVEYFDNFDATGGDVSPVRADSAMGKYIAETLPFDVQMRARLEAANLMELAGLNEDQVKDIITATHEFVDLGGDAQVSPQALQLLSSNGIATGSVQEYLEPVLFDRDSELFPDGVYDNLERIREGDNLRMIQSPDGNLRITSTTGAQEFPLNREQWQELTNSVTAAHDAANRPLKDRLRDETSANVTQEVGETLQSINDNIQAFNPDLTADQLSSIREGLVANREELTEAGKTLQAELRDGVAQGTANENYIINITPNVIELAEAQLGRQLTAAEEKDLRTYITNDGLAYVQNNGGLLGRPTDGLLPHLMTVATRRVGADVIGSIEESEAVATAKREQVVIEAQEAYDNASNNRVRNVARNRLKEAQAELDASRAGKRYHITSIVTNASGKVVRPFVEGRGEKTTDSTTERGDATTQRAIIQNKRVISAEAEVQRLQELINAGGQRRATVQRKIKLESALERLQTERKALDALTGNSN